MFSIEANPYSQPIGDVGRFFDFLPDLYGLMLYADCRETNFEELAAKRVWRFNEFIDLDRDDYGLRKNDFDFIFSFEVIEYLTNPGYYLWELQRALRLDGKMYLATRRFNKGYRRFSKNALRILLEYYGFKIEWMKYWRFRWVVAELTK